MDKFAASARKNPALMAIRQDWKVVRAKATPILPTATPAMKSAVNVPPKQAARWELTQIVLTLTADLTTHPPSMARLAGTLATPHVTLANFPAKHLITPTLANAHPATLALHSRKRMA